MSPRRMRKARPPAAAPASKEAGAVASLGLAIAGARAAAEKKATDILVLDVRGLCDYTDFIVIATARSGKQGRVIAEEAAAKLAARGVRPVNVHGVDDGRWVLCDFGDVIIHVFHDTARDYYDLESLWEDAARVEWESADLDALLGEPPGATGDRAVPPAPPEPDPLEPVDRASPEPLESVDRASPAAAAEE